MILSITSFLLSYMQQQQQQQQQQRSDDLMDKVSASQPWDRGFEPHMGHSHDSSYDTSTGWYSRVINLSCDNLFHIRAKINMFKQTK